MGPPPSVECGVLVKGLRLEQMHSVYLANQTCESLRDLFTQEQNMQMRLFLLGLCCR